MAIAKPGNGGGGYEYRFVNTPSDMLVCKICQYLSREPYLSGCCGHTFCKSCLDGAKKATLPSLMLVQYAAVKNILLFPTSKSTELSRVFMYSVLTRRKDASGKVKLMTLSITLETVTAVNLKR